jgi:TRAP-type mannitol/chloroaromatic compound transport system permease small subunit
VDKGGDPSPSALARALARVQRAEERLVTGMAYLCGGLFLLLAFYTTFDVIGRRYFGVFSGVTNEMGGYALALGASWAFAYTLKVGGHVRVDILLPLLSPSLRKLLDVVAMAAMALFATIVSTFLWELVASSYAIQATGHSIIQTPQWIPQAMMALGYTALSLVSVTGLVLRLLVRGNAGAAPAGRPTSNFSAE